MLHLTGYEMAPLFHILERISSFLLTSSTTLGFQIQRDIINICYIIIILPHDQNSGGTMYSGIVIEIEVISLNHNHILTWKIMVASAKS